MDWVGPSIEIVKLVGGRFVRYLKFQIKYNDLLQKFEESKQGLRSRKDDIESRLETQLQSAPYNVVRPEVEKWLKEVEEFIRRQDVVDQVNSWGYLSCCCRAVILEERTQEWKEIHDRGDNYTRDSLVIEDHSKKLKYYVENFNELKKKLQCNQADIGSKLNLQLVHGKIEMEQVKHWRGKVEEMLKGVKNIEDKVGGSSSHSSDSLVMLLREIIQEMERMCDEGSQLPDCLVIDDPSASAVELPVSKLQGNEAVKEKILAYLKGEEVAKLGVWGMGGIGKTTIMKHIYNEMQKQPKPKFKKIIWVTVSQNFQINYLQEQIAIRLKEQLPKDQNIAMRAGQLFQMLKEDKHKPFLLILDDVWESFDLNEVGIPEPDVGCKLVLTTRSQQVAHSVGCSRIIKVETLSGKEALELFLNKVGDAVLSGHGGGIKKDLESTLKKIVAECTGLPLAIVTVASSLKGISDPRSWSAALNQLRDYRRNVAGTVDDAFEILKFSYDRLRNSQIQSCFLYCALYPEDYNIPKEKIIEYWIDEGFIKEMETWHDMKDEGYDILRKLEENSLLEVIKDEDEGDCVRMHDLIRDMALDITRTSPRFLVEAGKSLTELPKRAKCTEDVEKVSLMYNSIEEIPSSLAFSTCIRLTSLLLAHNRLSTIPESVFEHMPELKILDLSFNVELTSLPNSVSKLVKLTTLLLESTSLEKVPSLSGLGSLKKLNLMGTKIKEVPEGLEMLKNLKCLFLGGSRRRTYNHPEIDEIADGVLSNLSELHELIVNTSRIKLKGDVVGRLKKLEVFHGWFPTANDMRLFLKCQPDKLSDYFIHVGSNSLLTHHFETILPRYNKVVLFTGTSIVAENMLFPFIQILGVEDCHNIRSLNDFLKINDAEDLRECLIHHCNGMECIFPSWINNPVVQTVEYLDLQDLHKLDGLFEANIIAKSSPPPGTFSSLKVVCIFRCKKLKKLFQSWKLVEYLRSLEKIRIKGCEEMEEIITSDPEGGEEGDIIEELILPKLKQLSLLHLPALKSICSRRAVMVSDSLKDIEITNCKGLRRIPFRLLPCLYLDGLDNLDWMFEVELIAMSPPQPCTFLSLTKIKIQKCRRVKKLFPSWKLVEYLQNLEEIDVKYCEEIEEIIGSDPEDEGGGDIIKEFILPRLKYLRLIDLPALKSICRGRAVMVCDSLESITIRNCKGIRRFPSHLPPRLYLYELDNLDWVFEEELIAMSPPQPRAFSFLKEVEIEGCKKIKKLFPSWKFLEYLQSLEEIWVRNCEEMEEIIGSDPEEEGEEGGDIIKKLILPKLKRLELDGLPKLKSIYSQRAVIVSDSLEDINITNCKALRRIPFHLPPRLSLEELDYLDWVFEVELIAMSPPQPSTFSSLKELKIRRCKRANKLFPSWKFLEYLQSLERIEVYDCEEMEEIIASDPEEEGEEGQEGGDIIKKLILPKLNTLQLQRLPKLKSICSRRAVVVCDTLEKIIIRDCKGLRRISFQLLPRLTLDDLDNLDWLFEVELIGMSPPQPHTFSSLKELEIWNCKGANKLFPSWKFVEYLQNLESICVGCSKELEEIIASDPEEEGEEGGNIIKKLILPKLKQLTLYDLPALKSICSRRAVMVCDFLKYITIEYCKGLKRIPLSLPLVDNTQPSPPPSLKKIYMKRREEEWWESLEWDHANAKDVLQPMVRFFPDQLDFPRLESE